MALTTVTAGMLPALGGLSDATIWRVTADFTGDANPIASNWEVQDTPASTVLGSAMTQSSGIFTFPSTGFWYVHFMATYYSPDSGEISNYNYVEIESTTDNSSYTSRSRGESGRLQNQYDFENASASIILDITDVSNQKVQFSSNVAANATATKGDSSQNETYALFKKLADT